jgi:hypothetical protein
MNAGAGMMTETVVATLLIAASLQRGGSLRIGGTHRTGGTVGEVAHVALECATAHPWTGGEGHAVPGIVTLETYMTLVTLGRSSVAGQGHGVDRAPCDPGQGQGLARVPEVGLIT